MFLLRSGTHKLALNDCKCYIYLHLQWNLHWHYPASSGFSRPDATLRSIASGLAKLLLTGYIGIHIFTEYVNLCLKGYLLVTRRIANLLMGFRGPKRHSDFALLNRNTWSALEFPRRLTTKKVSMEGRWKKRGRVNISWEAPDTRNKTLKGSIACVYILPEGTLGRVKRQKLNIC